VALLESLQGGCDGFGIRASELSQHRRVRREAIVNEPPYNVVVQLRIEWVLCG
jgi:hypothetical protein